MGPQERKKLLLMPGNPLAALTRRDQGRETTSINIAGLNVRRFPDKRTALISTLEPDAHGRRMLLVQDGKAHGGYILGHPRFGNRAGVVVLRADGSIRMAALASPESESTEVFFAGSKADLTGWCRIGSDLSAENPLARFIWHSRGNAAPCHLAISGVLSRSGDTAFTQAPAEGGFPERASSVFADMLVAAGQLGEMLTSAEAALSSLPVGGIIGEGIVTLPSLPGRTLVRESSSFLDASGTDALARTLAEAAFKPDVTVLGRFEGDDGAVALVKPASVGTIGKKNTPFAVLQAAVTAGRKTTGLHIPVVGLGSAVITTMDVPKGDLTDASLSWLTPRGGKPLWQVAHPGFQPSTDHPDFIVEDLLLVTTGQHGSYSLANSLGSVSFDCLP